MSSMLYSTQLDVHRIRVFNVPSAWYRLREIPMLWTQDKLLEAPPEAQDSKWHVIGNSQPVGVISEWCTLGFHSASAFDLMKSICKSHLGNVNQDLSGAWPLPVPFISYAMITSEAAILFTSHLISWARFHFSSFDSSWQLFIWHLACLWISYH